MKKIRIAVAQMNPTVGDFAQNTRKILDWIQEAETKQADLIVFPEMALSGYPIWDLANKKSFVNEGLRRLKQITQATRNSQMSVVLGYVEKGENSTRSRNSLAWISKGKIAAKYIKRLLPTYDVFLENIFFEPGTTSHVLSWHGYRVGSCICEDLWDENYPEKPLADLSKQKSNLVINISASPFYRGVGMVRQALVRKQCKKYGFPLLYVNQVGGQDDLIFDGRSFFCDERGRILFQAPSFREGLFFFDWDSDQKAAPLPSFSKIKTDIEEVYEGLVLGLSDYCRKNGFQKVVIGLSGGIDSAIVAALAVDALGPEAVLGVTMPGFYSSKGSWKDSADLAKRLGISFLMRPIKKSYKLFLNEKKISAQKVTSAMENLQARLRGIELMYISNAENRLLLSTGNKSELAMGYCTLYGDMAGGLCVIGDVYKTEVYKLAHYRNSLSPVIPKKILTKAPSAELRPHQKDSDSLPPYEVLDAVLYHAIEQNKSAEEISQILKSKFKKNISFNLVMKIIRSLDHNEYKRRQTPPILRVTQKAWFGRRMPITNRFRQS